MKTDQSVTSEFKEIVQINCDVRQGYYDSFVISDEYVFCNPKSITKSFYRYIAPFHILDEESFHRYEKQLLELTNTPSFLFPHSSENIEFVEKKGYSAVLDLRRMELLTGKFEVKNNAELSVETFENVYTPEFIEVFKTQFKEESSTGKLDDYGIVESLSTRMLHDSYIEYTYIAYSDSKPVAVVSMTSNLINKYGYVTHLVVNEQHRGKGFSKSLMHEVIRHAKFLGLNRLLLAVEAESVADRLYTSMGFKEIARSVSLTKRYLT